MNSRDRVLAALDHREPDRVPIDFCGTLGTTLNATAYENLRNYLGLEKLQIAASAEQTMYQLAPADDRLLQLFDADVYGIVPNWPSKWKLAVETREDGYYYTDEWGIRYRLPKSGHGHSYRVSSPLASAKVEDLEAYDWPDPSDPGRFEDLRETARRLDENAKYALVIHQASCGIFEVASWLRGFEKFLSDLILDKRFAAALMDRILEFHLGYWKKVLEIVGEYVDVAFLTEDLGAQTGPMMSPRTYEDLIKPRHKQLFDFIKDRRKGMRVLLHSDGDIYPLIEHLIGAGVDAINPVQVSAKDMGDTDQLKRRFGDRLTFWGGGCDTQSVLPFGTPTDVEQEVKKRLADLAPGGGFVFGAVQNIQSEVPPKNIVTMFEAARKYGNYPIGKR